MILEELKKYTALVTKIPALRITFGSYGMMRNSLGNDGVIISELAMVSNSRSINFIEEVEYLSVNYTGSFTFGFYGKKARENAELFIAMQRSELSHEWIRDNGIDIHAHTIKNLGKLYEKSKVNLFEVEVTTNYNKITEIETRRIDELQLDVKT